MIAIVCDTPYQLTSAILVADEVAKGEKIVFFINTYLYFEEQAFHYSDAHGSVHKILYYGKKHMGAGKLLAGLLNPRAMLKHIGGYEEDMDITAIICSRTAYMATYLYNACAARSSPLPVYLVEEGIGEYTGEMTDTRFTKACRALGRKTHMDRVTRAYFSAPSLYPFNTAFPMEKTPALSEDSRALIESVFNLGEIRQSGNPLDQYRCIFLSNPNSATMKREEDVILSDRADSEIIDAAARAADGDIIVKAHPLDPNFKKGGVNTYRSKLPMECLLFTMNCENKVFVSTLSTAMLTPRLLFGAQPYLVFAYNLVDEHTQKHLPSGARRQRYYDFMQGVAGMYADPSRCAAPRNMDELEAAVAAFCERAGKEG